MCLRINRFCCFDDTRKGSTACAFYTGVLSVGGIVGNSVILGLFDKYKQKIYDFNKGKVDYEGIKLYVLITLLSSVMFLAASAFLLIAVKKEKRLLMIPWMIWMVVLISAQLCTVVFLLFIITASPKILLQCLVIVVFCLVNSYCFSCVYSQYGTLRRARCSTPTDKL
ncbi:uncharacterized protein [Centruroides vittatus]|uniref:uncharacterized protein n=1 Tax=Centruroides vittatus TaxID=120091 RepID=UPI00350EB9F3